MIEEQDDFRADIDALAARLVPELPQRVLDTYSRLWQFETWLRRMVYLELRALAGDDWVSRLPNVEGHKRADKRLTHMQGPENDNLSYVQFKGLARLVSENWQLFEVFLPPKSIWEAKLEEIAQVRHRVAHFRSGHQDDLPRVTQLLRDIDQGFWKFCTSYNAPRPVLPQSDDPIEDTFLHLDLFPWTLLEDGKWVRSWVKHPGDSTSMSIEVLCRPWAKWSLPVVGREGFLYNVEIYARRGSKLDYKRFLEYTLHLHKHMVHLCLDDYSEKVRLTLPAVLGVPCLIEIVEKVFGMASFCMYGGFFRSRKDQAVQELADTWPEYVLGPNNPLTFLTPEMDCSFFRV